MGKKHDFLSPKAISNRMKARGLQKLRWYCQLCQKQCRDENGFKCHQTSESHRRQLELFGQSPGKIIGQYSYQFESDFMAHMRLCHPHSQVSANKVYNEFIRDKNHVHMNSTRWLSLSGFVQYLGKKGLCKIEQTARGWLIQLIPKDDETDVKRAKRKQRDEDEKQDDIRIMKDIKKQIKKASELDSEIHEFSEFPKRFKFHRDDHQGPLSFSMMRAKEPASSSLLPEEDGLGVFEDEEEEAAELDEELSGWIRKDIVVKVLSPSLKEYGYYKQKGVVRRVIDGFIGEIEMLESGDVVQVDQAELETVLPAVGGRVVVLTGPDAGRLGEVLGLDIDRCLIQVKVDKEEEWFEYDRVCKLYESKIDK